MSIFNIKIFNITTLSTNNIKQADKIKFFDGESTLEVESHKYESITLKIYQFFEIIHENVVIKRINFDNGVIIIKKDKIGLILK